MDLARTRPAQGLRRTRGRVAGRVAAALAVAACLRAGGPAWGEPAARFVFSASQVYTIDPARVSNPMEERLAAACFETLTLLDPTTGQAKPGAAASWETSADGKTWTFHIRPEARWTSPKEDYRGPLKASDFVWSWKRLLDPETKSPHAHFLEVCPGAKTLYRDAVRKDTLYRLANDWGELLGGRAGTKGEDVVNFVASSGVRRWAAGTTDAFLLKLLAWQEKDPMDPAKAKACKTALEKEAKASNDAYEEAKAHVGVDRGFFAKDEKTLVVQTTGSAPYLPLLLARTPLAPVNPASVGGNPGVLAFHNYNFAGNGAYVLKSDAPKARDLGVEPTPFGVDLEKNPEYWNAANVPTPRIRGWVDRPSADMIEAYGNGDVMWLGSLTPAELAEVRAAREPGWKPGKMDPKLVEAYAKRYQDLARGYYEQPMRGVYCLRFRCDTAPCDRKEIRQALASLVDRDALVKLVVGAKAKPLTRLVPPGTPGASAEMPVPKLVPADAKKLWGDTEPPDGLKLFYRDEEANERVKNTLYDAWQKTLQASVSARGGYYNDYQTELENGDFHVVIGMVQPACDDPLAYLSLFESGSTVGATGWSDPTYDALVRGAYDPAAFAAKPPAEDLLKGLKDRAALDAAVKAAASGKLADLEALRLRLCFEAEALLLEECVVLPLWQPSEAGVVKSGVRGFAADASKARFAEPKPLVGVSCEGQ